MKNRAIGLILLASCFALLSIASAVSAPGIVTVEATMSGGVGIEYSDIGPWQLFIGSGVNEIDNLITVHQVDGSSVTYILSAQATNSGRLTSSSTPADYLPQLKIYGVTMDGTSKQIDTGTIGASSSIQKNFKLSQEVTASAIAHDDYHITITYTLTT
jgi:hypothetical protein